jgi:hypothetical protein
MDRREDDNNNNAVNNVRCAGRLIDDFNEMNSNEIDVLCIVAFFNYSTGRFSITQHVVFQ